MTDGDSAELATELEIDATWYEIGISSATGRVTGSIFADARTAALARAGIVDRLAGAPATMLELPKLGDPHAPLVCTTYDVVFVNAITPASRRWIMAMDLLEEREDKALRAEHKRYDEPDDE